MRSYIVLFTINERGNTILKPYGAKLLVKSFVSREKVSRLVIPFIVLLNCVTE